MAGSEISKIQKTLDMDVTRGLHPPTKYIHKEVGIVYIYIVYMFTVTHHHFIATLQPSPDCDQFQ